MKRIIFICILFQVTKTSRLHSQMGPMEPMEPSVEPSVEPVVSVQPSVEPVIPVEPSVEPIIPVIPVCGINEIFLPCGDVCPITCGNKDNRRVCPQICRLGGGCGCKPNYVRSWNWTCIRPSQCPTCRGQNEFFDCGSACDTTCRTLGDPCPIINIVCNQMCYCRPGFARDDRNVCIPIAECPPKQCKNDSNAIILPCGDPCPVSCNNMRPRPCPEICIVNGCKCKPGYVKGNNGRCILISQCPPPIVCTGNEIYDNCPQRNPDRTCEEYFTGVTTTNVNARCIPGCKCRSGYLRNSSGRCVLPARCCTDPNSELVNCPNPCPGGTCQQPNFTPCRRRCFPWGCQCRRGYVKVSQTNNTCINIKSCC